MLSHRMNRFSFNLFGFNKIRKAQRETETSTFRVPASDLPAHLSVSSTSVCWVEPSLFSLPLSDFRSLLCNYLLSLYVCPCCMSLQAAAPFSSALLSPALVLCIILPAIQPSFSLVGRCLCHLSSLSSLWVKQSEQIDYNQLVEWS